MGKLLFYLLLAMLSYFGIRSMFRPPSRAKRGEGPAPGQDAPPSGDYLVRDPVCGTYLDKKDAVNVVHEGKTMYFCGEACREKFLAAAAKRPE